MKALRRRPSVSTRASASVVTSTGDTWRLWSSGASWPMVMVASSLIGGLLEKLGQDARIVGAEVERAQLAQPLEVTLGQRQQPRPLGRPEIGAHVVDEQRAQ